MPASSTTRPVSCGKVRAAKAKANRTRRKPNEPSNVLVQVARLNTETRQSATISNVCQTIRCHRPAVLVCPGDLDQQGTCPHHCDRNSGLPEFRSINRCRAE